MQTTELTFCSMTGEAATPAGMRPRLGPLALARWKPARWGYVISADSELTAGAATVCLMAGETEIASRAIEMAGESEFTDAQEVDLSPVLGDTPLRMEVSFDTEPDAGAVITTQGRLEIVLPAAAGGCLS